MIKDNTLASAKGAIGSTAEEAITIVSDVTKENVEKTINVVKDIAKNVKSKATKATTIAKKTVAKKTVAKKKVAKKIDVAFYVQYKGKEVCNKTIIERIHEEWLKSHKLSEINTLDIYLKVEEDTAYCLVNGEINIDLKLS